MKERICKCVRRKGLCGQGSHYLFPTLNVTCNLREQNALDDSFEFSLDMHCIDLVGNELVE